MKKLPIIFLIILFSFLLTSLTLTILIIIELRSSGIYKLASLNSDIKLSLFIAIPQILFQIIMVWYMIKKKIINLKI